MRSRSEILAILDELAYGTADSLEGQDLDFKEWSSTRSIGDSLNSVIEVAVCMANGGGGCVVWGVKDGVVGRTAAIRGIPLSVQLDRLQRAIYDRTDPKLTVQFEDLAVPEGTKRLILMTVSGGGSLLYTDTDRKSVV